MGDWAPIIRMLGDQVSRLDRPTTHDLIAWRGSKLTRGQAASLECGEVLSPPMFIAASSSRCVAELFRDTFLIQLRISASCKNVGLVQKDSGATDIVLTPYAPLE